jgi:arylsulfatase
MTQRELWRHSIWLALLVCVVVASPALAQPATKPSHPNVVIILADDMGYSDLGCYGSGISTPNIDRLASQGVRMTQFYNSARCCPSRAALLTGRYPHQVGIGAMVDAYAKWIRDAAHRPSYCDHLSTESPTIAELLRASGYHTIMCGKWHLGERQNEWPVKRGFDRSFVLLPGAMNYYGGESKGPRSPMALDDQKFTPPHDNFYSTDAFTDYAIRFVDEAKQQDKPFFLYLAYNAPHWPLQAPEEEIAPYRGRYDAGWQPTRDARYKRMVQLGIVAETTGMPPMDSGKTPPWEQLSEARQHEWAMRMSVYAAQITRMDRVIGKLLDELAKLGVADNTLILFLSDNGGAAEDPHRTDASIPLGTRDSFWGYDRPWATVSNTPWRLHKVTAYEGGISTPAIAYWPAGIPQQARGTIVREPAHFIDVLPTVLELIGAARPENLEGQSILPMLRGEHGDPNRTFCWEHEGNRAIRKGKWKLVTLGASKDGWELYDMEADRIEGHNLASERPEIVRELSDEYDRWAQRCGVVPWSEIVAHRPTTKPG